MVDQLASRLDTPIPVLDLTVAERNIRRMAQMLASCQVSLRPHFKTPRMLEVARLQLVAGAAGLTCATLEEAEALARAGVDDIFIAYPLWLNEVKAARLERLLQECLTLTVGIDSLEAAHQIARLLPSLRPSVRIEIDCGERRSGVDAASVGALATKVLDLGLDVDGIFTHGGHSYVPNGTERAAADEVRTLRWAVGSMEACGLAPRVVSAGSTPTVPASAAEPVSEVRPGTYVFNDRQQLTLESCGLDDVAVVVATTVVSTAIPGQFVIDAGGKSLGRDRPSWLDGFGLIRGLAGARIARLYDHHAVCELAGQDMPKVGDLLEVIPNHICTVMNLAARCAIVRSGALVGHWQVVGRGC